MFNMFKKQGTSKRSASTSMIGDREPGLDSATPTGEQAWAGDMGGAGAGEELSDAQLATCFGGASLEVGTRPSFGVKIAIRVGTNDLADLAGGQLT